MSNKTYNSKILLFWLSCYLFFRKFWAIWRIYWWTNTVVKCCCIFWNHDIVHVSYLKLLKCWNRVMVIHTGLYILFLFLIFSICIWNWWSCLKCFFSQIFFFKGKLYLYFSSLIIYFFSKKPAPTRQQELRDILLPDLLKCLTKNIKDIILNKSTAVVLLATLEVAKGIISLLFF